MLRRRSTHRSLLLAPVVAVAVMTPALTAPAQADGLGGISGWQPPTAVCGTADFVPLLITNATNTSQTGSMTIGGDLTEQVAVNPYDFNANCPSRTGSGRWQQNGSTYSANLTVPPGQTQVFTLALGGVDENLIGTSHTFSIGGLPGGTSNASWYDFALTLNADDSFTGLYPYYSGTGGTDPATNGQNGFNIVACNPGSFTTGETVTVTPTAQVMTPYSSSKRNATNGSYGWNQPICMAWLPEGTMVTDQVSVTGNGPVGTVLAAQVNSDSVSVAFETTGPVSDVMSEGVSLSQTPGSAGGFWYLTPDGDVGIEGVPAFQQTSITVEGPGGDSQESVIAFPQDAGAPAGPAGPATGLSPADIVATATSSTPSVNVSASVDGASGLNALVTMTATVESDEYTGQGIYLVRLNGPNGQSVYTTLMGPATQGASGSKQVSIPMANSETSLQMGELYQNRQFTLTFVVAPSAQVAGEYGDYGAPAMPTFTVELNLQPSE